MQEVDDLVAEWTPEPLVAPQTAFEEAMDERQPVIVGYEPRSQTSSAHLLFAFSSS